MCITKAICKYVVANKTLCSEEIERIERNEWFIQKHTLTCSQIEGKIDSRKITRSFYQYVFNQKKKNTDPSSPPHCVAHTYIHRHTHVYTYSLKRRQETEIEIGKPMLTVS